MCIRDRCVCVWGGDNAKAAAVEHGHFPNCRIPNPKTIHSYEKKRHFICYVKLKQGCLNHNFFFNHYWFRLGTDFFKIFE